MGRLIAGVTYATLEKVEGINRVAVVEQAIREIDAAAEEARAELGKARAEEHRIQSRRKEISGDIEGLAALSGLAADVDTAMTEAVAGLRAAGFSWADIAHRLGTTRQAAHQRYGGAR